MAKSNDTKYIRLVRFMPIIALALFGGAFFLYSIQFSGGLSSDKESWGLFGDFLGGLVNPAVGIITIYILALAYKSQREELRETRKELELSRNEQANASAALAEQNIIAERSSKIRELMDTSRLIHEELLRFYQSNIIIPEVPYEELTNSYFRRQDSRSNQTLKDLHFNYMDTGRVRNDLGGDQAFDRKLQSFKELIGGLIDCSNRLEQLPDYDGSNPLILSIVSYWRPVIEFMYESSVPFSISIMSTYGLTQETS